MIQVIYLNVEKSEKPKKVYIQDKLETFYEIINCKSVEMLQIKIGKHYYTLICDEEGRLKDNPIVSACSNTGKPMFVGNLIITGLPNENGDLTGLTDVQCFIISNYIKKVITYNSDLKLQRDGYILFCEY